MKWNDLKTKPFPKDRTVIVTYCDPQNGYTTAGFLEPKYQSHPIFVGNIVAWADAPGLAEATDDGEWTGELYESHEEPDYKIGDKIWFFPLNAVRPVQAEVIHVYTDGDIQLMYAGNAYIRIADHLFKTEEDALREYARRLTNTGEQLAIEIANVKSEADAVEMKKKFNRSVGERVWYDFEPPLCRLRQGTIVEVRPNGTVVISDRGELYTREVKLLFDRNRGL